jgi:AraC-like DNA-binding protein
VRYSFGITDYSLPLYIDSVSNNWEQEDINRKKGYPYVHWLQTINGEGEVIVNGQTIRLLPGQGILINKDIRHAYHSVNGKWTTAYFTFGGELISEMLSTLSITEYINIKEPDEQLSRFVNECYWQIQKNQLDMYESSVLVYQFLILIKKNYINDNVNARQMNNIVNPIMEYIKSNYMNEVRNEDFVRLSHYSLQYILQIFQQYFHRSPRALLNDFRIRKAKELLVINPEQTVEQIGKLVGFNTNSYFISAFKKREKVTPGQFREFFK